ncbi:unnamed protein product [Psylliodes chrysocephalus]|uniref:CRAL-TRIO domain-containing protein n=1 Tax=Psylliodes chrysocephalus TaxID=3402493 RepID=A0A9P0CU28_9CUCU|nr:unnamed protein product [Psylliodes chrysocephala]
MPDRKEIENGEVDKERCIAELRKLMQDQELLKNVKSDDPYLERFLIATDYKVQAALEKMLEFYSILAKYPRWFTTERPTEKKDIIDRDIRILLGKKDKEGRPIYIVKLGNMDPSIMDLVEDVVAVDDFFVETLFLLNSGIENGLCVVIDISNFSLKLTRWLTPSNINVAVKRILSMPIKEFKYHVINSSLMIHVGIRILWPFLPKMIKDNVKFHFSDLEAFYQYVDKDVLPEEYGGKIKFDYSKQHSLIYDRNDQIFEHFKTDRLKFLENVNSDITKTD